MYMSVLKISTVFLTLAALTGCASNSDGSRTLGMKGSAAWHKFAPIEEKIAYFAPTCKSLGFKEGTTDFSRCVQDEMNGDRSAARQKAADISRAFENMKPQPTITCRTYGNLTRCN